MRCYRKILRISYKDHVTNEEVRAKIQQAIGPQEDLMTTEKKRKLQWYGCLPFIRSGQNRWEDNIREWAGLEFAKYQRAVENREKWRKLVVKSSVVPQRPS